jgi:hypothetical protein
MRIPTLAALSLGLATIVFSTGAATKPVARFPQRANLPIRTAALPKLFDSLIATGRRAGTPRHGAPWVSYRQRAGKPDTAVASSVYACEAFANLCNVYTLGGTLTATVSGLNVPQGVAVDSNGYVYISNSYSSQVLIYTDGATALVATLTDSANLPAFTVASKTLIASSDFYSSSGGPGELAVYKNVPEDQTPSYYLTDPSAYEGESVAFDSKGNCYWSFNTAADSGPGYIDEFQGCAQGATPIRLPITTSYAGGVAFDSNDNLWYTDQLAASVNACTGTTNCATILSGGFFVDPVTLNWDGEELMYVMDAVSGVYQVNVLGDPYPMISISSSNGPVGTAADLYTQTL